MSCPSLPAMIWHQKLQEWSLSTKLVLAKNFSLQKYRLRFHFYLGFPINFFLSVENGITSKTLAVLDTEFNIGIFQRDYTVGAVAASQEQIEEKAIVDAVQQEAEKSALTRASDFFFIARFLPLPKSYTDRFSHTKSQNLVTYTRLGTRAQISSKNACTNPMQTTCGQMQAAFTAEIG